MNFGTLYCIFSDDKTLVLVSYLILAVDPVSSDCLSADFLGANFL